MVKANSTSALASAEVQETTEVNYSCHQVVWFYRGLFFFHSLPFCWPVIKSREVIQIQCVIKSYNSMMSFRCTRFYEASRCERSALDSLAGVSDICVLWWPSRCMRLLLDFQALAYEIFFYLKKCCKHSVLILYKIRYYLSSCKTFQSWPDLYILVSMAMHRCDVSTEIDAIYWNRMV